jgi:hypothetical protein
LRILWVDEVEGSWAGVRAELERAFTFAREAAKAAESFVFVVNGDDLLGRRGAANAMVATGVLSAARTAALEGIRGGWTANVVAWDGEEASRAAARAWAERMLDSSGVTGELVRVGPGHLGKALP